VDLTLAIGVLIRYVEFNLALAPHSTVEPILTFMGASELEAAINKEQEQIVVDVLIGKKMAYLYQVCPIQSNAKIRIQFGLITSSLHYFG
jgi:hypothetical protein